MRGIYLIKKQQNRRISIKILVSKGSLSHLLSHHLQNSIKLMFSTRQQNDDLCFNIYVHVGTIFCYHVTN